MSPRTRVLALSVLALAGAGVAALATAGGAQSAGTCSIYWTGATSTAWNTASNWSLSDGGPAAAAIPAATDFVCMSTAPTRSSVVAASGTRTISGIRFNATPSVIPSLALQGGTFTLNTNDSVINNLSTSSGMTVTGTASLTLTGTGALTSTTFTGATKTVDVGADYTTTGSMTLGANAGSTTLVDNGTLRLTGTTLQISTATSGSTANALSVAGTLEMTNGASILSTGSGPVKGTVVSTGTLNAGGTSRKTVSTPFSSSGTINVTSGTFTLFTGPVAGAPDTGTVSVAAGATMEYAGTRTVPAGTISGAGTVLVSANAVTFGDGTTLPNLTITGGTVSGSLTVTNLTSSGGGFSGAGTTTLTGSSSLCLSLLAGYHLVNQGTATWNANACGIPFAGGSVLENAASLTVTGGNNGGGLTDNDNNPGNAFVNDAGATLTFALGGANSIVTSQVRFTNAGTVSLTTGRLSITGGTATGTTDTGTYSAAAGTRLSFGGTGTRTIGAASFTGDGQFQLLSGTLAFTVPLTLPNLTMSGGTITGSPTIVGLVSSGGTFSGSGTGTLTGTSTLCLGLTGGYRLINQGTATYAPDNCGYLSFAGNSTLENAGSLTVTTGTSGYAFSVASGAQNAFLNDAGATLTIALAGQNSAVRTDVPFSNAGTVTVTTGRFNVNAGSSAGAPDTGTYSVAAGARLNFASGSRSIGATTLAGDGTFEISGGTVAIASGATLSNLTFSGGTITGSPTIGALTASGGTFSGTGTATLTGTSTLCLSLAAGYRLLNQGTATYAPDTCGYLYIGGNSTLENAGSLTVTTGTSGYAFAVQSGNQNAFLNDAGATLTFALSGVNSAVRTDVPFTNAGTVAVNNGRFFVNAGSAGGVADTGTYTVAATGRVGFSSGNRTISAATFNGAGPVEIGGGTVVADGTSFPNLVFSGGTINGSPTIATFTGTSGNFSGAGTATLTGTGSSIDGSALLNGYRLLNQGTLSVTSMSLSSGATFENAATVVFVGTSGAAVSDDGTATSVLNDAGATMTVTLNTAGAAVNVGPRLTNNGTITATKGTLRLSNLVNLSNAGALTGGTYTADGGTISFPRGISTNNATTSLGATGGLTVGSTTTSALNPLSANTGTLTIGQTVNGTASFTNTGTVAVTGGTWRVTTYTQTSGSTTVASGATLKSGTTGTAAVAINGGVLLGAGTVQGAVAGVGTIQPGAGGAGTLTVTGTWSAAASTTLAVSAGATSTQLAVSGAVNLGGTLAINTVSPAPAVGTVVTVVSAASVSGIFASVTGIDVPGSGGYWTVGYTPTSVTLTFTGYPQVSVAGGSVVEGDTGTAVLPFTVSLSAATTQSVTVAYATSDGTASAATDYTAASGTLTFAPGVTSQTVNVTVTGDTLYETDESVVLTLSAPSSATLGTASANGTIVNDDAPPAVSIGAANGTVGAGSGATLVFPVTLSVVSGVDVTVAYATSDGTAIAPVDYTATSGTLTIPAGSTTASIPVSAPAQAGYAPPKTFTVTLSNPTAATLGSAAATGTISNSNPSGGTPSVASVTPSSAAQATTTSVVINGQNLPSNATVSVSGPGVTVSNVVVSTTSRITATFTITAGSAPGARNVTVNGTGGPATCTGCFTVTARPLPGQLSRTAFATGNVDAELSITGGVGYQPGTTVKLTKNTTVIDATSVTVDSSSALTAYFSIPSRTVLGAYRVVFTNPDGGSGICLDCVTISAAPKVTAVSPSTVAAGSSTSMTFTGTGFVSGARLSVQGATLSNVVFVNATTMTATVTFAPGTAAGSKTVKVFNPASAGSGSNGTVGLVTVTSG